MSTCSSSAQDLHLRSVYLYCRLVFVNKFTVRLVGEQTKHGGRQGEATRMGHPVSSQYEKRKKQNRGVTAARRWRQEFIDFNHTKAEVDRLALQAARELRSKEVAIKPLRQEVEARQTRQDTASWRVKRQQPGAYADLVTARRSLREKRTGLLQEEQELKRIRQQWYRMNKMSEAAGKMRRTNNTGTSQETTSTTPSMTTPTLDKPTVEDSSKTGL